MLQNPWTNLKCNERLRCEPLEAKGFLLFAQLKDVLKQGK